MEIMNTSWFVIGLYLEAISTSWLVLALALVFSIMLTPLSMFVAHKLGAVDEPNHRSVHKVATPRLGGIGICLAMLFAMSFFVSFDRFMVGFLLGLIVILITGLLDDINPMSHRIKFVGEIIAVAVFVTISGVELSGVGDLFGLGDISFGSLSYIITIFCVVGLINAMNLSDGLDGLAGGMAVIASLFFALLAFKTGNHASLIIAAALAGSLTGFLAYNSFPARLFMGDVGSLMIGYTCGVLALSVVDSNTGFQPTPMTAALILAVPLLDTLIVMGGRILQGKSPFSPDQTHLHHRLIEVGLSQNQAVSILYALMFLYGFLGLLFLKLNLPDAWQFTAAILMAFLLYRGLAQLRDNPWSMVSNIWKLSTVLKRFEKRQFQRTYRVWFAFGRVVPNIVMLSFLFPLVVLQDWRLCLLPIIGLFLLIVFRHYNKRIVAMLYGMFYLIILAMLFIYDMLLKNNVWDIYWTVITSVTLLWLIISLFVGHARERLSMHSFEILLILISWFAVAVTLPGLKEYTAMAEHLNFACIHAIPILLISKLSILNSVFVNKPLLPPSVGK